MLAVRPAKRSASGSKNSTSREPRLEYVTLAPGGAAVICKMAPAGLYELPLSALSVAEEWDGSPATGAAVILNGWGAEVRFRSGKSIDFGADFVLRQCDAAYRGEEGEAGDHWDIGARVRRLREARGLTLAGLAARTGMAPSNLSRLEHGRHYPTLRTLQKVARALGVPVRALVSV
jgi:DNA-binding XRE family transcriptional regulator